MSIKIVKDIPTTKVCDMVVGKVYYDNYHLIDVIKDIEGVVYSLPPSGQTFTETPKSFQLTPIEYPEPKAGEIWKLNDGRIILQKSDSRVQLNESNSLDCPIDWDTCQAVEYLGTFKYED